MYSGWLNINMVNCSSKFSNTDTSNLSSYDNILNNILLNPTSVNLVNYLKLIGFEEALSLVDSNMIYIQPSSINVIISSIDLQKIAIDKRHYLLCKILCSYDIRNLNYVTNNILYEVWRSIF